MTQRQEHSYKWVITYGDASLFEYADKSAFVAAIFGGVVFSFDSIERLCVYCAQENKSPFRVAVRKITMGSENN